MNYSITRHTYINLWGIKVQIIELVIFGTFKKERITDRLIL